LPSRILNVLGRVHAAVFHIGDCFAVRGAVFDANGERDGCVLKPGIPVSMSLVCRDKLASKVKRFQPGSDESFLVNAGKPVRSSRRQRNNDWQSAGGLT